MPWDDTPSSARQSGMVGEGEGTLRTGDPVIAREPGDRETGISPLINTDDTKLEMSPGLNLVTRLES